MIRPSKTGSPIRAVVEKALKEILPEGASWTARVRVNAVASNARHSSGVTLVGIDPSSEAKVSFIGTAVSQGRYLNPDDRNGIVIGEALMKKFDTKPGHKLVLMSQDTQAGDCVPRFSYRRNFQGGNGGHRKTVCFCVAPDESKNARDWETASPRYRSFCRENRIIPKSIID